MRIPFLRRRTAGPDPELEDTGQRLNDIEHRSQHAHHRAVSRGERNHFTEMWQQIIGQDPGGSHG